MRIYLNPMQHQQIKIGQYTTSKIEIRDLIKSWIIISLAISLIDFIPDIQLSFFQRMLFAGITVGVAFLFHELAHKITAQHYGCFAEFRSNNGMLMLALIMALVFKFIFFAPGAVVIAGPVGKRRNGVISASGPGINFMLAILFLIGTFYFQNEFVNTLFTFGYMVNTWIGLFNLIPFGIFDGKKILNWNKLIYYGMLLLGLLLLFSNSLIGGIVS
jgi:Zn-dependent protease